jgi:hypothetical protein
MVAPVKASNVPPSRLTFHWFLLRLDKDKPLNCLIQFDFFNSILSPKPGVSAIKSI